MPRTALWNSAANAAAMSAASSRRAPAPTTPAIATATIPLAANTAFSESSSRNIARRVMSSACEAPHRPAIRSRQLGWSYSGKARSGGTLAMGTGLPSPRAIARSRGGLTGRDDHSFASRDPAGLEWCNSDALRPEAVVNAAGDRLDTGRVAVEAQRVGADRDARSV